MEWGIPALSVWNGRVLRTLIRLTKDAVNLYVTVIQLVNLTTETFCWDPISPRMYWLNFHLMIFLSSWSMTYPCKNHTGIIVIKLVLVKASSSSRCHSGLMDADGTLRIHSKCLLWPVWQILSLRTSPPPWRSFMLCSRSTKGNERRHTHQEDLSKAHRAEDRWSLL